MIENVDELISDFYKVANLAQCDITRGNILYESKPAPHRASILPKGKQAVYVFSLPSPYFVALKVGKVGPNSNARFLSQHYNPESSRSNLAKSLLGDSTIWTELGIEKTEHGQIGNWIRHNVDRENFFIDAKKDMLVLSLLEIFLQCRLNPRYEG